LETIEIAKKAAEIVWGKHAADVVLLDTRQACSFVDYFVICSSETERHIDAIREAIDEWLHVERIAHPRYEGTSGSGWVLLDFGDLIIHIFGPHEREYYQLDDLWSKAQLVFRMQ